MRGNKNPPRLRPAVSDLEKVEALNTDAVPLLKA
jgi:hypothetical protein